MIQDNIAFDPSTPSSPPTYRLLVDFINLLFYKHHSNTAKQKKNKKWNKYFLQFGQFQSHYLFLHFIILLE